MMVYSKIYFYFRQGNIYCGYPLTFYNLIRISKDRFTNLESLVTDANGGPLASILTGELTEKKLKDNY